MKDQYFGDFGDYQKVSLLNHLQKQNLKTIVHWMKTRDDGSADGKHIAYFSKPENWRSYSPDVFDYLKEKVKSGIRTLQHIENSPFCEKVDFISDYVEDIDIRRSTFDKVIEGEGDVILFDPDNGIEVASTSPKTAHKYVMWDEITQGFDSGKSVIIYQHFARMSRPAFIQKKIGEINKRFLCDLASLQVKHSVYFFLIKSKHKGKLKRTMDEFSKTWQDFATVRHH